MKTFFFIWMLLSFVIVKGQNIGIGTLAPTEKLEIATGNLKFSGSDKGILLNSADRPIITRSWDPFTSGIYQGVGRWGLFMEPNRITIGFPAGGGSGFKISGYQPNSTVLKNVMDVSIDGSSNGIVNIDGNVGVGMITPPTEKLDVNGSINLRGVLKIDGSAGNYGQTYITGGPSLNPQWKTLAFANTTRFAANLSGTGYSGALTHSANYNTNASDITIGTSFITVNRTGLYHLDGFLAFSVSYSGTYTQPTAPNISIFFDDGTDLYYACYAHDLTERIFYAAGFGKSFYHQVKFSYDLYLTAGQTIAVGRIFGGQLASATFSNAGTITGYLISE